MTNTTRNFGPTHEHNFNAQGLCVCGLTHDQFNAQEAAVNAQEAPEETLGSAPPADPQPPVTDPIE